MKIIMCKTIGKKHLLILSALCICAIVFPLSVFSENFQVVGAEFYPLMYKKKGAPAGFYFELLQMMLKEMPQHHFLAVEFYPVPRMLMMLADTRNMFALGIARNAQREQEFKWVGPSIEPSVVVYRLKSRSDIRIHTLADLRSYKFVTGRSYAAKENLFQIGVPEGNIEEVNDDIQSLKMLFAQRVDFAVGVDVVFLALLQQEGYSIDDLEAFKIDTRHMYYAFNKDTDDHVIQEFQNVLDRLKQTEKYEVLLKKYLP